MNTGIGVLVNNRIGIMMIGILLWNWINCRGRKVEVITACWRCNTVVEGVACYALAWIERETITL
jgi:hypothetical protein